VIPALVLGSGLTALGAQRCLGRVGVPTIADAPEDDLAAWTRWYRPVAGPMRVDSLARDLAASALERAVLVPCTDDATLAVARLPAELRERFPACVAPAETIERLSDKGRLLETLDRVGVPHPETWDVASAADVAAVPDGGWAGAFLKPRDSQRFFAAYKRKGVWVHSREEAVRELERLIEAGFGMVVQWYVPGPRRNHVFLDGFRDRRGTVQGLVARRRIRMWPPDFGNNSAFVSIPVAEIAEARDSLARLLDAVGYRGTFSAEFKQDARDGAFKLLEVNVRPWWYVEFAQRCGFNAPQMMYDDALGRDVTPARPGEVGRRLVYIYYDAVACWHDWVRGELTLAEWTDGWLGADTALFAWDDPAPRVRSSARWAWRWLSRKIRAR